jgi:ribosomal protein S18 acetylase RimI-like enzyme
MNTPAIDAPATTRLLDRPVWSALSGENAPFAQGAMLARRYPSEIAPFGAVADETPECFEALASLASRGSRVALVGPDAVAAPNGFALERNAPIVQMMLAESAPAEAPGDPGSILLGPPDVAEMLDLAGRTRPGPFGARTIELGTYLGIRVDGALVAMAGERMRFDRFAEISAVCVDPGQRGKGYAALLMMQLAQRMQARGLTPILHVFEDNHGAIALYSRLGFRARRTLSLTVLARQ